MCAYWMAGMLNYDMNFFSNKTHHKFDIDSYLQCTFSDHRIKVSCFAGKQVTSVHISTDIDTWVLSGQLRYLISWAPSQYSKRRLFVRSRKVSKPRDWYFKWSYCFEIWQAHWQHCCQSACQISERSDNSKYKSRGFETLRDHKERRLFGYWDGALVSIMVPLCLLPWY